MSSPYERGRRGGYNGRDRGFERRDERDHKRSRDDSQGRQPRGKFQKGGGRGGRGARGGRGGRTERPEFHNAIVTIPSDLATKSVKIDHPNVAQDTKIEVITNYFRVDTKDKISMTMYRIDFTPSTDDRRSKFAIINESKNFLGLHVYDGDSSVYLMEKLPENNITRQVTLRDGSKFEVTFRETREILYTDAMFFTILNSIIRRCFEAMRLNLVGRHYYDPIAAIKVREHKVDMWPGYKTSIRQHEDDLLLSCELTYKLMRTENVWDQIKELAQKYRGEYKLNASKQIVGTTVLTTYNNKKYRIDEIDWENTVGRSTFFIDGREKTYQEYYQEKYNIKNLDPIQPLLVSKSKAKNIRGGASNLISLIPQLCSATGVNDSMRYNFQMMKDLAQYTRKTPAERVAKLLEFNRRLQDNPECKRNFTENNMTLSRNLVKVDARRIVQEEIYFRSGEPIKLNHSGPDVADWTKTLKDHQMFSCKQLVRWVVICSKKCERDGLSFLQKMIESGRRMGMEISEKYKTEILANDRTESYTSALIRFLQQDPMFIIVIVDSNKEDRYAAIKRICYCSEYARNPVPVQVLCAKTIAEGKRSIISVATKVAIQINCKLGGIPWVISIPLKGLLVIGFDVTHDTNDKSKSFGAMVASLDPQNGGGKFFCCANRHSNGEQISNNLGISVIAAVKKFQQLNGTLPQRIIIYRDGVGDGQIEYVNNCEVQEVVSKINQFYGFDPTTSDPKDEPKFGFIIVNKRINTRFFVQRNGRAENPLPGTVVDSVITLPERYDFYLVSQSVTQGTVAPVSYNIIYDKMSLHTAHIQRLSFKLCHTYYNWSGTTRVPSVVQYAKKLALLIGQHLHQEPTMFSDDRMLYFL